MLSTDFLDNPHKHELLVRFTALTPDLFAVFAYLLPDFEAFPVDKIGMVRSFANLALYAI
ncbi:hypothetical protein EXT51_19455 [Pectobacterium carotovorum subsp. carotovorum]|uniref:hypothetical protein n=1 Tax=Pectobacterium carotovorum TaxID=554 RepID=UPI00202D533C|nr:hypothetical protein [Pectobacterium carotovorum]MCL6331670.1 hypothetical protein [Pectobacterium carotovorum subsp. carotovorum]